MIFEGKLADLQREYADALLAGDQRVAERAVAEAIEAGFPEGAIDDQVIAPSMRLVGDLWRDGQITVADEHLATQITLRVLALEREVFRAAAERRARVALLCAVEHEQHVVGLEMAASVLEHAGYEVLLLGADMPTAGLVAAVVRHRPDVVGLSTATVLTAVNVAPAVEALRAASPNVAIVLGGAAAETAPAPEDPMLTRCAHVADAPAVVDALMQRAPLN